VENKPTEQNVEMQQHTATSWKKLKRKSKEPGHCSVWYLHLGAAVLKPELDLARLQAELPAERGALVLVGVRALLEHPAVMGEHARHYIPFRQTITSHDEQPQGRPDRIKKQQKKWKRSEIVRLELLNLARRVPVIPLPLALAVGALRFVAEIHCRLAAG
jgi:hypothetical protein